jgi:hypothetical protein
MTSIPENVDALLSREAAARALTAAGYVTSPSTLATKATRGNGPAYRIFGKRAIYRWGDLIGWAEAHTAPLRHSTSEAMTTCYKRMRAAGDVNTSETAINASAGVTRDGAQVA